MWPANVQEKVKTGTQNVPGTRECGSASLSSATQNKHQSGPPPSPRTQPFRELSTFDYRLLIVSVLSPPPPRLFLAASSPSSLRLAPSLNHIFSLSVLTPPFPRSPQKMGPADMNNMESKKPLSHLNPQCARPGLLPSRGRASGSRDLNAPPPHRTF